jgi:glycosyltransferase involved in cell wall biosynthesis
MKQLKVAFVYDRVNKIGGAERVLIALHEIWPEAPLYTAVYDKKKARWASVFKVHTSFLQWFPWAQTHHEFYPWATPMAFESFSWDEYDIVISVTSAEAKDIITKPSTIHICYCLTPTRYLWSGYQQYQDSPKIGLPHAITRAVFKKFIPILRQWDILASRRPDAYIAISNIVAKRIVSYYNITPDKIIYPPVDTILFTRNTDRVKRKHADYFLVVARLVGYKRVDLVVDAFTRLGWPLVIVGSGWEKESLVAGAGKNIRFFDYLADKELVYYYQHCRAFVFAGEEDFGIAAAEAAACGKPIIAYKYSGVAEVVIPGKTGVLFDNQSVSSLTEALKEFTTSWYDSRLCRKMGERFSKERFRREMRETVEMLYTLHHRNDYGY